MTENEFLREWKAAEPKIRRVLRYRKVFGEELEDILADTRLRCYMNRHSCELGKFGRWSMSIARNLHIDRIRLCESKAVSLQNQVTIEMPGGRSRCMRELTDRSNRKPFHESFPFWFYKLPKTYQTAARLRACGCSVAEIAAMTGDTVSSVKTRLYRVKKEAARLIELDKQKDPTGLG
jgi:RNA polymerase sigma factor (sigma-70 family)